MVDVEFLILGQGLAGSLLARELISNGKTVHVVDAEDGTSASRVAAGMFNPVVFKRLNLSWKADEFLPLAIDVYRSIERELGSSFCHQIPLARFFNDQYSANQFSVEAEMRLAHHLDLKTDPHLDEYPNKYGYGIVKTAGYVDLTAMLTALKEFFIAHNAYGVDRIEEKDCLLKDEGWVVKDEIRAKNIICATGTSIAEWSAWEHVPVTRTKGQVLTIQAPETSQEYILNNGKFLLPLGENRFRAGSTYEWTPDHDGPDEEGRQEIFNKLGSLLPSEFNVVEHKAGNRPTCKDRRPVLGTHHLNDKLHIFNGLGTRGVIIAPAMAKAMAAHLMHGTPIDTEASVLRFSR